MSPQYRLLSCPVTGRAETLTASASEARKHFFQVIFMLAPVYFTECDREGRIPGPCSRRTAFCWSVKECNLKLCQARRPTPRQARFLGGLDVYFRFE